MKSIQNKSKRRKRRLRCGRLAGGAARRVCQLLPASGRVRGPAHEPALCQGCVKVSHGRWRQRPCRVTPSPAGGQAGSLQGRGLEGDQPLAAPGPRQGPPGAGHGARHGSRAWLGTSNMPTGERPRSAPAGWLLSPRTRWHVATRPGQGCAASLCPPQPDGAGGGGAPAFSWRTMEEGTAARPGARLPAELTARPATVTPESVLRAWAVLPPTLLQSPPGCTPYYGR